MIRRLFKWTILFLATLIVLGAVAYIYRASLLVGLANQWIVNSPAQKADAIVVLGGGSDIRPIVAARLFREGWAPRVLVLQPQLTPAQERGLVPTEGDLTKRLLESEKVPARAIELIETKVTNTYEESQAISNWVRGHGAKCLLVPTDLFHTRRAGWIIRRQLPPGSAQVVTIAAVPRLYSNTNWWQNERGLVDFQNEVLKFAYYWWNY